LLNESDKIEDAQAMQLPPGTGLVKGSLADTLKGILDIAYGKNAARPLPENSLSESA
jgi:hypothetical protein